MTLPNKNTLGFSNLLHRGQKKRGVWLWRVFQILFVLATFIVLSGFSKRKPFPMEKLQHEQTFVETFKSCLPQSNSKCKTYIPPNSAERVAVVTPPGKIGELLFRTLQDVVNNASKSSQIDVNLIHTTSIPPYGYGKTHGWTRIIRIIPVPLMIGVVDTLQAAHNDKNMQSSELTEDDVKSTLRQFVRYHCRLNHVAAHTSLWTITANDLISMPFSTFETQANEFLGFGKSAASKQITADNSIPYKEMREMIPQIASDGSALIANLRTTDTAESLKELDDVLQLELKMTNNLKAWPCASFWTVGDHGDILELNPIAKFIATAVSPNCTDALTECFVKRDKCEAAGDGLCV